LISVDSISVIFGHFELLSNISFLVNPKERIGLTGRNGSGKTTLLKIINGSVKPSSGRVVIPSGVTTGYLPQQIRVSDSTTIFNETLKSFSHLEDIRNEVDSITGELAKRSDFETPSYIEKCDSLALLEEQFRLNGGDIYIAETEQALTGLGFDRRDFRRGTSELSGGWRMRIELAKILLKKPDLLLLDEPTNHLDIESIQWFEYFLKKYHGSIILVSHDRAFLDNVTGRTIELSLSRAYDYKASYSTYLELRRERRDQHLAAFRNQQKVIEDTERFIERFRYKNTKAVQVQSRIKKLENIRRDFVANVSHEIKTPITAIKGFVETLRDGEVSSIEDRERFLGIVSNHVNRLEAIINDLLRLSSIEKDTENGGIEFGDEKISDILKTAIQICRLNAENKGIGITLDCDEKIIANVNAPLLEQAVVNLLDNAIKYSENDKKVKVNGFIKDNNVIIEVVDEGKGLEKEHFPRLFERFYRVDKARSRKLGGTGLGLAIVKHITQAHNGKVSVESIPGKGSIFTIKIPIE